MDNIKIKKEISKAIDLIEKQNLSESTKKIYKGALKRIIIQFKGAPLEEVSGDEINNYLFSLIKQKNFECGFDTALAQCLKYYYNKIGCEKMKNIHLIGLRSRKRILLSPVDYDDIKLILQSSLKIKYRCMIALMYLGGLDEVQLSRIKSQDVCLEQAKVTISPYDDYPGYSFGLNSEMLSLFKEYKKKYPQREYFFYTNMKMPYLGRSISMILNDLLSDYVFHRTMTITVLKHTSHAHFFNHLYGDETAENLLNLIVPRSLAACAALIKKDIDYYDCILK